MRYILGSGLVALLARDILGSDWQILPFYKSRFFTFNPSLADNFIVYNDEIDMYIKKNYGKLERYPYRCGFSVNGQIFKDFDRGICEDWVNSFCGVKSPGHLPSYMKHNMSFDVYDIKANELYISLMNKYASEINAGIGLGQLVSIRDNCLVFKSNKIDYEKIINTLPLNALCSFMGLEHNLASKDAHFIHLYSEHLDFEGYNQLLVVDNNIPFYKVSNIAKNRYLFYFSEEVVNPGEFFMAFIKDFDIIDGTSMKDYITLGDLPKLDIFESNNIFNVGSYAQWDMCMDLGSCIARVLKYANRGHIEANHFSL